MEATIFHKTMEGEKKIHKPFCDRDLRYIGQCEGGMGD